MVTKSKFPVLEDVTSVSARSVSEGELGWYHGFHDHPFMIRNKPRVMIRVEVLPVVQSVAGYACKSGVNFMVVYKDDLKGIQKLMPTESEKARWEIAKETFEAKLMKHARSLGWAKVFTSHEKESIMVEARATTGESVEREYYLLTGNETSGFPPVTSLEIGYEVEAPETPATAFERVQKTQIAAFAEALKEAGIGQSSAMSAATMAEALKLALAPTPAKKSA